MKKYLLAAVFGVSVFYSTISFAKDDVYVELGVTAFNYSENYSGSTYTWSSGTAARVILGSEINENFALELLAATGISSGSLTISGYSTSVALNSIYGLYVKPKIAVNENVTLFTRIGFANSTGTATIPALSYSSQSSSGSTASYGIGASYKLSEKFSINADYMVYANKDAYAITGTTLGFGCKF